MIILIDAYNLFKTVLHTKFVQTKERTFFLQLFEEYAAVRVHEIILVFDGTGDVYDVIDRYNFIKIYYSGYKQTADDFIKVKLKLLKGKDVLLVTSDRDIRKFAENCLIESIGSQEFYKILQNIIKRKQKQEHLIVQTVHKTSDNNNLELDILMEMASRSLVVKEQDKEVNFVMQDSFKNYNSKKNKKLLKKIVKL